MTAPCWERIPDGYDPPEAIVTKRLPKGRVAFGPAQRFDGGEVLSVTPGCVCYSVPPKAPKPKAEVTRESEKAEWELRKAAIKAETKKKLQGPEVKKKRRTKDQMAAVRAERAARAKAATPEWLQEPDELLEQILTSTETH